MRYELGRKEETEKSGQGCVHCATYVWYYNTAIEKWPEFLV